MMITFNDWWRSATGRHGHNKDSALSDKVSDLRYLCKEEEEEIHYVLTNGGGAGLKPSAGRLVSRAQCSEW